ncbi:MAG: HPr-rel-A system PqqD family peptide chaperone [Vicinamibacterales bacterium]
MGSSPNWRLTPGSIFHWREWDHEFVVYHENSGDTHRLNAIGAAALRRLTAGPAQSEDLAREIADELSRPPLDVAQAIDELIARLHDIGLIEPAGDSQDPASPGSR